MIHAENGVLINEVVKETLAAGNTAPKYHATSRIAGTAVDGCRRGRRWYAGFFRRVVGPVQAQLELASPAAKKALMSALRPVKTLARSCPNRP